MRVSPQHAQVLVTGDTGNLHDVQPFLEQPSGRLVAQVVEAEVFDGGPSDGTHVRALYALGGDDRGLAEAVISSAQLAEGVNWAPWHETRF